MFQLLISTIHMVYMKWFVKQHQVHNTNKSDSELNTLLNDKIFVSPRDFFLLSNVEPKIYLYTTGVL